MIDPLARRTPQTVIPAPEQVYVLCEGTDDAAMVRAAAKLLGLELRAVTVSDENEEGDEIKAFGDNARRHRARALGIVRDKETDGEAEEQRVRDWLVNAGLNLPEAAGSVIGQAKEGTNLRVGYFLNPDSSNAGAVEQLFVDQITDTLKPCVEEFVANVEATGLWAQKQSPEVLKDKVRLRAYLAARQGGANTSLNSGLVRSYLSVETSTFDGLKDFLRRLCT